MSLKEQGQYKITYAGSAQARKDLLSGRDFRLDEEMFSTGLCVYLRPRERDLLRLGMAIYVVDRLVRRRRRRRNQSCSRAVELQVQVSDPDFWSAQAELIAEVVWQLSDDFWSIRFTKAGTSYPVTRPFDLCDSPEFVSLYSGGLDSAGGLARRLRDAKSPVITVTALHQHKQRRRVQQHVEALSRTYRQRLFPFVVRTTMVKPPHLNQQELTQRCRAFLFVALGGAVASLTGSADVELYESGVGALNLPLMAGMISGGRTTKGCHPEFLRLMSKLISEVAERRVTLSLPFRSATKAEVVKVLGDDDLENLANDTVSCVHYPLRQPGPAKQCGICLACIGRRQALLTAGIADSGARYKHDLFGSAVQANALTDDDLMPLRASLLQISDLEELSDDGTKPDLFRRHVFGTHILSPNEPVRPWVNLMRRYRDEWQPLVEQANRFGIRWATLLPQPDLLDLLV